MAFALLSALPSLATGFVLDDYVLCLLAGHGSRLPGFHPNPLFLFSFTSGRASDDFALMDEGALLPWFSDPRHLNAFFRPLSSLTHVLDFALFPAQPWLMHLHSLAWLALLLSVAQRLYRGLCAEAGVAAILAFALFALDGSHATTATWIANRNALCSAALALPSLLALHRAATLGSLRSHWLGPLAFALGLCAGETALGIFGYLVAYALVLDRSPPARRVARLAPYLALIVLWRVLFQALGLGALGSGAYHDPGRDPIGYALALVEHAPVLLCSLLALPVADFWFWGAPALQRALLVGSVVLVGLLAWAAHVLLSDDREARFWGLGMVLSTCAVAASIPGQRLLLVPSVGAAAFGAKLIAKLLPAANAGWRRFLLAAYALVHVGLSPLLGPLSAVSYGSLGAAVAHIDAALPEDAAIAEKTVVVINPAFDALVSYIQPARAARAAPRPAHLYWLASASSELTLETLDANSVRIAPARGFLYTPLERHYRGDARGLEPGARVELSEMSVEITARMRDGRPAAAEFRFREPLRSARYLLRYFDDTGVLREFKLPAPGARVHFAHRDFFVTLFRQALRSLAWNRSPRG